jgi:hypothetical protein
MSLFLSMAVKGNHPARALDLVAHEGQQRRDEQGTSRSGVEQQACRQEIHDALSPARALDYQQPLTTQEQLNRFPLIGMEICSSRSYRAAEQGQRVWSKKARVQAPGVVIVGDKKRACGHD